jgi:hypothetical protein
MKALKNSKQFLNTKKSLGLIVLLNDWNLDMIIKKTEKSPI